MANREHPIDSVVDAVVQWLHDEPKYFAEALRGGYSAPFAAQVSEQDKLRYYQRQLFQANPDGSIDFDKPNTEGRDALIKLLGIEGYTQVMTAVLRSRHSMQAMSGMDHAGNPDMDQDHDSANDQDNDMAMDMPSGMPDMKSMGGQGM